MSLTGTLRALGVCGALVVPLAATAGEYLVAPVAGLESPPAGELADIDAAIAVIRFKVFTDFLRARAADPDAIAVRDAHPKAHGCVRGEFTVHDDLAPAQHSGVFSPGARYPAWVRFSNATGADQPDGTPDARGMAIKLLEVPGPKLLDGVFRQHPWFVEEPWSQDFVLINHPVFFVADVRSYLDFSRALASNQLLPLIGFFLAHPRELALAAAIVLQDVYSPLEISYHGMAPVLFGSGRAGKYSATPVSCADGTAIPQTPRPRDARDYLREAMVESLDEGTGESACFDFSVRIRTDLQLPIEDATVSWSNPGAPQVSLGRLEIPPQNFDSPAREQMCENLSFMPWHAVPEHQPLGGLNRSRLHAYKAVSELRHWLNQVPAELPEADDNL